MRNKILFCAQILIFSVLFFSCKKEENDGPAPTSAPSPPNLKFEFVNSGNPVQFDQIQYTNAAGNNYSISRLQFYISNLSLTDLNNNVIKIPGNFYVDARNPAYIKHTLSTLPYGTYKEVNFDIAVDSLHNFTDSLPNTLVNSNMVWPEAMGGGYHFLKLEGDFTYNSLSYGYAVHLGNNYCLSHTKIIKTFTLQESQPELILRMDINEWFANPNTYDFNADGNYTMGDSLAMIKIAQNGVDVFQIP